MCCSYIIAEWLYNILLTSHEKNSQMNFKIKICIKNKTLFEGVLLKVKYLTKLLTTNLLFMMANSKFPLFGSFRHKKNDMFYSCDLGCLISCNIVRNVLVLEVYSSLANKPAICG